MVLDRGSKSVGRQHEMTHTPLRWLLWHWWKDVSVEFRDFPFIESQSVVSLDCDFYSVSFEKRWKRHGNFKCTLCNSRKRDVDWKVSWNLQPGARCASIKTHVLFSFVRWWISVRWNSSQQPRQLFSLHFFCCVKLHRKLPHFCITQA